MSLFLMLWLLEVHGEMWVTNGTFLSFHMGYDCKTVDSCVAPNVQAPYSRGIYEPVANMWKEAHQALLNQDLILYEEIISGSQPWNLSSAIVVWGKIPSDKELYWSIGPYCFTVCKCVQDKCQANTTMIAWASLTDSYSIARIQPRSDQDYMAFIFSFNPLMVYTVEGIFVADWQKNHPNETLQIYPVILPAELYSPCFLYDVVSRVALYKPNQRIPHYHTTWYTDNSVLPKLGTSKPLIPRGNKPDETLLKSYQEWVEIANGIAKKNYVILNATIQVGAYLRENFPGGLDNGSQCIMNRVNCRNDNRDCRYMNSEPFDINPETEAVLIVALDHSATMGSRYSNIGLYNYSNEVSYNGTYTGRFNEYPSHPVPPYPFESAIRTYYSIPPLSVTSIFAVERIYYITDNGVGPETDSVLPMVVFKVAQ